jgi:hypothetical protein
MWNWCCLLAGTSMRQSVRLLHYCVVKVFTGLITPLVVPWASIRRGQQDQPEHRFRDFLLQQDLLDRFADPSEADTQAVIALRATERVCAVALRYLVLNVLMRLDTPSFTSVALVDSTV